jgi:hypothetical protein
LKTLIDPGNLKETLNKQEKPHGKKMMLIFKESKLIARIQLMLLLKKSAKSSSDLLPKETTSQCNRTTMTTVTKILQIRERFAFS